MSDLIDRQKAIEALQKEIDKGKPPFNDTIGAVRCGVRLARNIIEDLPSAQPVAKDINVPCTDTISRQAAIDALGDEPEVWTGKDEYAQGLNNQWHYDRNALKALPSVQEWIPVTERLPEVSERVLCQCRANNFEVLKLATDRSWIKDSTHIYMSGFVVAWMPLPEPYKGEE